jgi:hypothetical protein
LRSLVEGVSHGTEHHGPFRPKLISFKAEGFLPATSPGCFALAAPNLHYDSYENYLFALARALREEYRAIVQSGPTSSGGSASAPEPTAGSARSLASVPSTTLSPGSSSAPSPRAHGSPPNASGGNA